jgi:hypothetical protein
MKNWKLKEALGSFEIINNDSIEYRNIILEELKLPVNNCITGLNRSETLLNWGKIDSYCKFNFDFVDEEIVKDALQCSSLSKYKSIIMLYGFDEPVVKISTGRFVDEWEEFVRSTKFETIIFSEDFKLIIEITRSYHMHSNFFIFK